MAGILDCQWKLVASQFRTSLQLTEAMLHIPVKKANSKAGAGAMSEIVDQFRALERRADERVKQGLAPPKEIYETPHRDRIDWSTFPEWARPSDPELFQGCGHEG
jgi:hypothetical protein